MIADALSDCIEAIDADLAAQPSAYPGELLDTVANLRADLEAARSYLELKTPRTVWPTDPPFRKPTFT